MPEFDKKNIPEVNSTPARVSVHGGHSREFCLHAEDTLEDVVQAYLRQGFAWVGITEHMPPIDDRFLYPDERAAKMTAEQRYDQFARYIAACRALQNQYASQIDIYVGFETETYEGSASFIKHLIREFEPDYIVGSVHHVENIGFDLSPESYQEALNVCGGYEGLYCRYFDLQNEMLCELQPAVVGHFDLIRIFDPDYQNHLALPTVQDRIKRNLTLMRQHRSILDFNVRALAKGAEEPYCARPILETALEMGVAAVPGDDSHGVATVGMNLDFGMNRLAEMGFNTQWPKPAVLR